MKIKVCICVAYDWAYLKYSLPLIYPYADSICISLDKDLMSWSGNSFFFDKEAFNEFINGIDNEGKIILYEDNFHLPGLLPIQNECRQRLLMTEQLGEGGWFFQIDADEYFLNFKDFVAYLRNTKIKRKVNITCPFIEIYKQDQEGYFLIDVESPLNLRFINMATNAPKYDYGRVNGYFNIKTNFFVLHNTMARTTDEVYEKIKNWGHSHEVNKEEVFSQWKNIDKRNYQEYKNFHPLSPSAWPSLKFIDAANIEELGDKIKEADLYHLSRKTLLLQNSLFISRSKALFKKFF